MEQDAPQDQEPRSKSARKRAATARQDLGVRLAALPDRDLQGLDLPESLLQAIVALRGMKSHGAQVRQRQYIGKLMRHIDAAAVEEQLATRKRHHDARVRTFRRIEQWRDRLLRTPAQAVPDLLRDHPRADTGILTRLLEQAALERRNGQPPAAARALFAWLRTLMTPGDEAETGQDPGPQAGP